MMRIRPLVGCTLAVMLFGGCSSSTPPDSEFPDSDAAREFVEQASQARTEALEAGASDLQLSIIDEAISTGEVTLEQFREALDEYSVCLDASGLALIDMGMMDRNGFPMPDYVTQADDSPESMALMDRCDEKHLFWVNMLYQAQPSALAAGKASFAAALPKLIPCLQEGGVQVDDNATADEVQDAMMQFMQSHSPVFDPDDCTTVEGNTVCSFSGDPAQEDPAFNIVPNCLHESGISSF